MQHSGLILSHFYEHFKGLFEDTHGAKICLNTILLLLEYITLYITFIED